MPRRLSTPVTSDSPVRVRLQHAACQMSVRAAGIPVPAVVPYSLRERAKAMLQAGNFEDVLRLVNSQDRLLCLKAMWRDLPASDRPALLAAAMTSGDAPVRVRTFLCSALRSLRGTPVVDGEQARVALSALPEVVTIYRGTNAGEVQFSEWGVCWTLDPDRALWFATQHGRFRDRSSPPVVVMAEGVPRADLSGLLTSRREMEVLALPEIIDLARVSHRAAERFQDESR